MSRSIITAESNEDFSTELYEEAVTSVTELPELIRQSFTDISEVESRIYKAIENAESIKGKANDFKELKWYSSKKDAINNLQDVVQDMAESEASLAELQKIQFEYQQQLSKIIKALFGMGLMSIAANRTVVREIQLRLKEASEEELSDLARQELANVVRQLQAQQDIMYKQEKHSEELRSHKTELKAQRKDIDKLGSDIAEKTAVDEKQDRALAEQKKKDAEHDRKLAEQEAKDIEHDRKLAEQEAKDIEHDRKLADSEAKDIEHDRKLAEREAKDRSQDDELERQAKNDERHDRLIEELIKANAEQDRQLEELHKLCAQLSAELEDGNASAENTRKELDTRLNEKAGKASGIVSLVIAAAALILSIVHFFI